MVVASSLLLIVIGIAWTLFFAARSDWIVVASEVVVVVGAMAALLAARTRLRVAAIVLIISMFIRLVGFASFLDLPSEQIPRSAHHFLIPLALASYLMLRGENIWLRHGMPLACLAGVVFFASSNFGVTTRFAVPDAVRGPGTWINNISAMGILYLLLHILMGDIDRMEQALRRWAGAIGGWMHRVGGSSPATARGVAQVQELVSAPADPTPTPTLSSLPTAATDQERVRLMGALGSCLLVGLGVGFGLFYALRGQWTLVLLNLLLLLLGLTAARMLLQLERVRLAAIGLVLALFLIFLVIATMFEIPADQVSRSAHYYFPALAVAACFVLRSEDSWLQHALPLACLAAFVCLASSKASFTLGVVAVDHRPSPWNVSAIALAAFYLLVHICAGDIRQLHGWLQRAARRLRRGTQATIGSPS